MLQQSLGHLDATIIYPMAWNRNQSIPAVYIVNWVQRCLKAAVRKEFVDDNRVKVNSDGNFVNALSGRRGIYQAGIKASFSSTLSGHFGVGYSHGAGVESPWNAVAGVNWSF